MAAKLRKYYEAIDAFYTVANFPPLNVAMLTYGDFNGDGYLDLLMVGAYYPMHPYEDLEGQPGAILLGKADGTYKVPSQSLFPTDALLTIHPRKLLVADFNGDGRDDFFVADHGYDADPNGGAQNVLYLSKAGGGWKNSTDKLPQVSDYTHTAAFADIDNDGDLDIFAGNGFDGNTGVLPYMLINNGKGAFTRRDDLLPISDGEVLHHYSGHSFVGAQFDDLNRDGRPDLIINAGTDGNPNSFILWNDKGSFENDKRTDLPEPTNFSTHLDLDSKAVDINGDHLKDMIVVGTQTDPGYDGWFVQILQNTGNGAFEDVTNDLLAKRESTGGTSGVATQAPVAYWVKIIDFNHDGYSDFHVEISGQTTGKTPLIWLNDGTGHFSTLTYDDIGSTDTSLSLIENDKGFSFISVYTPPDGGVGVYGMKATKVYDRPVDTIGNARLYGEDTNDTLTALSGNDYMLSRGGADRLKGNGGNDRIFAGDGNDVIFGGMGADRLQGGAGADTFAYISTAESSAKIAMRDTIMDFSADEGDVIDLRRIDANSNTKGDQSFAFLEEGVFSGHARELILRRSGADMLVLGDTDGNGKADFSIVLTGISGITADDFML